MFQQMPHGALTQDTEGSVTEMAKITEHQLVENGRRLIAARRHMWDLERRSRFMSEFEKQELAAARREYRRLLAERRELSKSAQLPMELL